MITSFTLDRKAAASADGPVYVNESGAYIGTLTQVSVADTPSGATYIDIAFKTDDGRICFPRMFITKKDGSKAFSHAIFQALLAVLGIENAPVVPNKVYRRDGTSFEGHRIPAIEAKHVGLLLQKELRTFVDKDGIEKDTYQMNIVTPFDTVSRRTAREILSGANEAKLLDAKLKGLKDRDSRKPAEQVQQPPAGHPAAAAIDDDMPF